MNLHKIIKRVIYAILVLLALALIAYGVSKSNFTNIKKYDEKDKSPTTMTALKQKIAQKRHYSKKVEVIGDGMANLGDFHMNINGGKILTTNISLKYNNHDNGIFTLDKTKSEITQKGVILRNAVINAVHNSKYVNMQNNRIKTDIKNNLNKHLSNGQVEDIYFNKFIIN